ncbi:serine/threonine kinase-like domain-containing protein STKLD1 [Xenia sp. Carnegie-2017]|uniref:serine/threonine kinase-like domain-containing protein STKLD1 n=1 Tax=Xenia sp. Carnegie-2017 TaxID=2897299 RepID=UPI001F03DF26|nr:serine/threonine kinase-like domain-containing protein STKLD1 [Xenia sp. Carnegie-2017]
MAAAMNKVNCVFIWMKELLPYEMKLAVFSVTMALTATKHLDIRYGVKHVKFILWFYQHRTLEKIMDNYKLKQRLGKGAQGSVYLVENKVDGKEYVLKKVECNDESEANKAFQEAMALQDLQHPFICGYREFFVTWDKQESAMCVCIVMEYYKLGDLERVLKKRRSKQEFIEEMVVKKWLGQIVQALAFVHRHNVIHRDLKPSNIFVTEGLNIKIGDFGVSTIMDDARTRTRTTVGTMNWMAPEVLRERYDERSDVWSLGCILLELATAGFLDSAQASSVLFEVKQSPRVLEDILLKVSKYYDCGKELCQTIQILLRRNFQQRPTAFELCDLPFVKECFTLSGKVSLKLRPEENDKAKPVPKDKGIAGVIYYMKENKLSSACQIEALNFLVILTGKEDVTLNTPVKKEICVTMKNHMNVAAVQIKAFQVMINVLPRVDEKDVIYTTTMILPTLMAMRSHGGSRDLQKAGCQLLMGISADETAAELIGKSGGVQDILAALRLFPNDSDVATSACAAIWSLAVNESNCKIVTEERGLQDICAAMKSHNLNVDLIESACSALWSLSMEDENIEVMEDNNTVSLLVEVIKTHVKVADVVKNACMALASIVEADESCAYQLLNSGGEYGGVTIIVQAAKIHNENENVMENICTLFSELSEYDDVITELNSLNVMKILHEAKRKFQHNEDMVVSVLNSLTRLEGGQHSGKRTGSARSKTPSLKK